MFHVAITEPYVDYNYYVSAEGFAGVEITSETDFKRAVKRVTPILDEMTFDRIKDISDIPDCVKDALCSMCETYAGLQVSGDERKVTAENNDGFSQSFKEYDESNIRAQIRSAGKSYLANTGLLYKGVHYDDDEC